MAPPIERSVKVTERLAKPVIGVAVKSVVTVPKVSAIALEVSEVRRYLQRLNFVISAAWVIYVVELTGSVEEASKGSSMAWVIYVVELTGSVEEASVESNTDGVISFRPERAR